MKRSEEDFHGGTVGKCADNKCCKKTNRIHANRKKNLIIISSTKVRTEKNTSKGQTKDPPYMVSLFSLFNVCLHTS